MHEPDILFLDEPTSGVDPLARREFWRRINALAERGVTVLVTTHFMEEAEYCDRLAIMAAGEILTLGTPAEIKASARTHGKLPSRPWKTPSSRLIESARRRRRKAGVRRPRARAAAQRRGGVADAPARAWCARNSCRSCATRAASPSPF